MSHDPLDAVLPNYIEFARLKGPKEATTAVQRFFSSEYATLEHFVKKFGVDLTSFPGFYLEVGAADVPTGPIVSGMVKPILVLQQSKTGKNYTPYIMKHEGFFNMDQTRAWVSATSWDEHVKDTLTAELKDIARKERDRQERMMKHAERKADRDVPKEA